MRKGEASSDPKNAVRLFLAQAHGELSDADWHLLINEFPFEPLEESGERDILAYQYKEFVERRRQERR